jgi:ribosomal protein S14
MLSAKIKDLKYRKLYKKNEKIRLYRRFLFITLLNNKTVLKNPKIKQNLIFLFLKKYKIFKLSNKTKTRLVNRCVFSNRGRSVYRPYGLSRFFLREFMQFGILPGYKKAV